MSSRCPECGGPATPVRARFEILLPTSRFIAEDVPALRCPACGRDQPADHVRPQIDAVLELVEEVEGATARKSFGSVPLQPEDPTA